MLIRIEILPWLSTAIRPEVTGRMIVEHLLRGATLRDLLREMSEADPAFARVVFDPEKNEMRYPALGVVNDQLVEFLKGLDTRLTGGDRVTLMAAYTGGSGDNAPERRPVIQKRWHGSYVTARSGEPPPPELLLGIAQFNRGEFFEQHETLEDLWRSEPDDVRYLYHGILLVGVGLYHLTRGNYRGAVSKLEGGLDKLRWFEPSCQGVDVTSLVADATRFLAYLKELGPERADQFDRALFPRVRVEIQES